jgi:GcrA cell cycle regulator
MAWTTEMIEGLKKMWKKGLTTNEIAKELGVSKNSIVGKVHRLNLTARPSPIKKKDDEEILPQNVVSEQSVDEISNTQPTKKPKKESLKKALEPEAAPIPVETELKTRRCIKLHELDSHTCRWPIGDPKDDRFCFCGNKVRAGQTYCDEHAAIAYVKPAKK